MCVCVLQRQVRRVHLEIPAFLGHQDYQDIKVRQEPMDPLVLMGSRERWLSTQTDRKDTEDRKDRLEPPATLDNQVISTFVIVFVVSDVTEKNLSTKEYNQFNSFQFTSGQVARPWIRISQSYDVHMSDVDTTLMLFAAATASRTTESWQ